MCRYRGLELAQDKAISSGLAPFWPLHSTETQQSLQTQLLSRSFQSPFLSYLIGT